MKDITVELEKTESEKMCEIYAERPWLFNKETPNMQFNEYILQLNKKTDSAFFRYSCPNIFSAKILDQYEENLIWSAPIEEKLSLGYISVFGINPNTVLLAQIGKNMNNDTICAIGVHTNHPVQYFYFLATNKEYIVSRDILPQR